MKIFPLRFLCEFWCSWTPSCTMSCQCAWFPQDKGGSPTPRVIFSIKTMAPMVKSHGSLLGGGNMIAWSSTWSPKEREMKPFCHSDISIPEYILGNYFSWLSVWPWERHVLGGCKSALFYIQHNVSAWFQFPLENLLDMWTWAMNFITCCLSSLICKLETIMVYSLYGFLMVKGDNKYKYA